MSKVVGSCLQQSLSRANRQTLRDRREPLLKLGFHILGDFGRERGPRQATASGSKFCVEIAGSSLNRGSWTIPNGFQNCSGWL